MFKNVVILATLAIIIALPFVFRQTPNSGDWRDGDPVLTIISPHNEAIRYEFEHGYSAWHAAHFKRPDGTPQPARIDWRNVGGTTEISRYLTGTYTTSAQAWWTNQGKRWPSGMADALIAGKPPADSAQLEVWKAYRAVDDSRQVTSGVDLFFGGGEFDHYDAFARGFGVAPWPENDPPAFVAPALAMIPKTLGGEIWRTPTLYGCAISTFGICFNTDRLHDLDVATPPSQWTDLADFRYFGQVGVTDPTKSGSIAKAFEMLVHQQMHDEAARFVKASGVADADVSAKIAANEKAIDAYQKAKPGAKRWETPAELDEYQRALERGFDKGLHLIQAIGANARYFTDSATKVSLDVSVGDAAVGMTIDFYGRFQAQASQKPDGTQPMRFVTPVGGTSVSCDPITLLRGAPHRDEAAQFIGYVLSVDGQRLWTYKPGTPGGPEKYALRRLPIRRDFYPSTQPTIQAAYERHIQYAADVLGDPTIDPYQLAQSFEYYPRWTQAHFGPLRELTRAMCMNSGQELRDAWQRGHAKEDAFSFGSMPTVTLFDKDSKQDVSFHIDWRSLLTLKSYDPLDYMREWTEAYRKQYRAAAR